MIPATWFSIERPHRGDVLLLVPVGGAPRPPMYRHDIEYRHTADGRVWQVGGERASVLIYDPQVMAAR